MPEQPPCLIPTSARWGLLWRYAELMAPTTEAPIEFHYGAIATAISSLFGGPKVVFGSFPVHTNLFGIVIGVTGASKKTTAVNAAKNTVREAFGTDIIDIAGGVGSREGLLKGIPDIPGKPILYRISEFTGLLKRANMTSTSGLIELMLDLADRPTDLEHRLSRENVHKQNPNVAILSDATPEYLAETFAASAIDAGLLNRLSLWTGIPGQPKAFPPPPDDLLLKLWRDDLHEAYRFASITPEVAPTPETVVWWTELYHDTIYPAQSGPDGQLIARTSTRAWQIALLYALLNLNDELEIDHLRAGYDVAAYLAENSKLIARGIGAGERLRARDAILGALDRHHTDNGRERGATPAMLHRRLSVPQRSIVVKFGGYVRVLEELERDDQVISVAAGDQDRTWYLP